jgi:hypothetical protein
MAISCTAEVQRTASATFALMTTLFSQLAELKPELKTTLTCVFIASEEASGPGIGG